MTEDQTKNEGAEPKKDDKELNFRALESKYEKMLADERQERQREKEEFNKKLNEFQSQYQQSHETEDDDEYVDTRRLSKKLTDFEKKLEAKIETAAEKKARLMFQERDKEKWQRDHEDFYNVLEKHADEFQQKYPHLANSILQISDPFEKQRMAYENIKALGIDKPKASIQETVNQKQRGPYYQPSNVGSAPYSNNSGDFSPTGQKSAYENMKALQARMRI